MLPSGSLIYLSHALAVQNMPRVCQEPTWTSAVLKHFYKSYSGEHIGSGFRVNYSEVKKIKKASKRPIRPVDPVEIGFGLFFSSYGWLVMSRIELIFFHFASLF